MTDLLLLQGNEDKWRVTITCLQKLDWNPDPSRLLCIRGCKREFISDGWCDPDNNNKHCRWDGGDCCPSTTKNRIVRRMPSHCSSACDCKDPDAIENQGGEDDEDDDDDDDRKSEESGSDEEGQYKTST